MFIFTCCFVVAFWDLLFIIMLISILTSWQVGEYGECSVPCGGGKQSRSLACVQKTVTGRITSVAFHRCPDLIPLSERSCNLQFCQAEWRTSDWGMV